MKYLILIFALAMSACASPDYAKYTAANTAIETARHNADAAKWQAMAQIAGQGDATAKVAAVMAMAMGQGQAAGSTIQAPSASPALQWASVLVPGLTSVMGMRYNYLSTTVQSNNARDVAVSTNATFAGMGNSIGAAGIAGNTALVNVAGMIQAPAANITTTLSGTGTMGSGAYTTNANPILSGTGTLGSGAYSTLDTHAVDNHTITPAPVVVVTPVTPVVPVVVNQPVIVNTPVVINPPVVVQPIVAGPTSPVTVGP